MSDDKYGFEFDGAGRLEAATSGYGFDLPSSQVQTPGMPFDNPMDEPEDDFWGNAFAGTNLLSNLKSGRGNYVSLFAIFVNQQSYPCSSVWIVLYCCNRC